MGDLVAKLRQRGRLVLYSCAGTFLAGNACMMLSNCGQFLACEIEVLCFNMSLPSVVEAFAKLVLHEDSNVKGSAEGVTLARWCMYVSARDQIKASKNRLI